MEENNNQLNRESLSELENKTDNIKTIHTYESDMANLIRNEGGSVADIAIAEQERKRANPQMEIATKIKLKNIIFVAGSIFVIIIAIWLSFFLIKKSKTESIIQLQTTKIQTFISYDDQSTLDVTNVLNKDEFNKILQPELKTEIKIGTLKSIFLNTNSKLSNTSDFLKLINANMPGTLARSLTDKFMIGIFSPKSQVVTAERKNHLFIIFQTKDYNQTFAGMLEWEKTMLSDMFLLFNIDVSGDRQKLFETSFKDIVISNKDARVLRDQNNVDILYYLFVDNNTFVITDDQDTVREIISRLVTQNIKPL